jgi:periplasmic divalent cation tolerance protein
MKRSSRQILVVLVSTRNLEEATKVATALVNANLAACANIVPAIQSVYRWKGKIVKEKEVLVMMKSTKLRYRALEKAVKAIHSYETPEIIALPVHEGLAQYLAWVRMETHD